jgi:DNA-binding transcriptional regulator YbjK
VIDDLIKKAQTTLAEQKADQLQAIADEIQAHNWSLD